MQVLVRGLWLYFVLKNHSTRARQKTSDAKGKEAAAAREVMQCKMWHAKMKGKGEFFRCYSKDRDIFKLFARKPDEFSEISISWQIQFLLETQSHPLKEFPFIVK